MSNYMFKSFGDGKYIEKEAFLAGTANKPVGYVSELNLTSEKESKEATGVGFKFNLNYGPSLKEIKAKEHKEIHAKMEEIYKQAKGGSK